MYVHRPENPLETTWPSHLGAGAEVADRPLLVAYAYGRSDRGRVRASNEDQFLIASPTSALRMAPSSFRGSRLRSTGADGQIFVIADGMGGHAGGAQASALAVRAVEDVLLSSLADPRMTRASTDSVLEEMKNAMHRADMLVCQEAARRPELAEMGTTLTMAYRYGPWLFIAHAGDSRAYIFRSSGLCQLTEDHTLVHEMVRAGAIAREDEAREDLRHIITNVLGGTRPGVRVDLRRVRIQAGDVLLLCTDGLTDMVSDSQIAAVLAAQANPREACNRLVDLANEQGGKDNITVIVVRFETPEN